LNSQDIFGDDIFILKNLCSYPIVWFDSMSYTFDDHKRLEFFRMVKRLCCALTLLICMPNEPMPNESLSAEQETYVEEGKI
jgi:hypothetical protein